MPKEGGLSGGLGLSSWLRLPREQEVQRGLQGPRCESLSWGAGALPSPQISRTTQARRTAE